MVPREVPKEYKTKLDAVVNYILQNLNGDLSLETLAKEASYSPFHLQRLFKQAMGISPKQYIVRIRLETAAHYLLAFQHKTVTEVAYDCGFSSPSVFARAFKGYFGLSAEQMRENSHQNQLIIRKDSFHLKGMIHDKKITYQHGDQKRVLQVEVRKIAPIPIVFQNTQLKDTVQIQEAFKDIIRFAEAHDILTEESRLVGVLYPTQDRYSAAVTLSPDQKVPQRRETIMLSGGKYAVFKVKGTIVDMFQALRVFHDHWLPESGYKITELFGFEFFTKNPALADYANLERELHIPIGAV